MAGSGRLQADPLFQGLTRPVMIMGVSYMYFVINSVICFVLYINTEKMIYLFVVAPLVHGIGYLICLKEPRAMELLVLKMQKGLKCLNRRYHGYTNSYDV